MSLFGELPRVVSIERQIEAAEREIGFRRRVYARRVAEGRMSQDKADEEVACMEAIAATLREVKAAKEKETSQ